MKVDYATTAPLVSVNVMFEPLFVIGPVYSSITTRTYPVAIKVIDQKYHHARVHRTGTHCVFLKGGGGKQELKPSHFRYQMNFIHSTNYKTITNVLSLVFNSPTRFHVNFLLLTRSFTESRHGFRPFTFKSNQITTHCSA
jgi:hypothetical protein